MRRAALLTLSLLLWPAGAADAVPGCFLECEQLEKAGTLRDGVGVEECAMRVCQAAARRAYQERDFEGGFATLEAVGDQAKGRPGYEFDRGLFLYAFDRFDEAIESFDLVLERVPDSFRAADQRAYALARLGRVKEARAAFQALVEKPSVDREIYRGIQTRSYLYGQIALLDVRAGDLEAGRAGFRKSLDLDGYNSFASAYLYRVLPAIESGDLRYESLGLLQSADQKKSLGRVDDAVDDFEAVLNRSPRFEIGYDLLGELFLAHRRYAECEDVYRRGESNLPGGNRLRIQRIRCGLLLRGATSEEAQPLIVELREVIAADPDNRAALEVLGALER